MFVHNPQIFFKQIQNTREEAKELICEYYHLCFYLFYDTIHVEFVFSVSCVCFKIGSENSRDDKSKSSEHLYFLFTFRNLKICNLIMISWSLRSMSTPRCTRQDTAVRRGAPFGVGPTPFLHIKQNTGRRREVGSPRRPSTAGLGIGSKGENPLPASEARRQPQRFPFPHSQKF
jgi:hypothetical protein